MNLEQQLELQAWVDGELPDGEARQMADLALSDDSARALR